MDAERTEAMVREVAAWPAPRVREVSERVLAGRPLFDVEAAGSCNVHCDFCPRLEMARPAQVMSPETFGALSSFLPDDAWVMWSGLGDALTNRRLEDFIGALRRRGISSSIITNGILLDAARQRSLADAGLAEVQVSCHGTSSETYGRVVVRGADLEGLRGNLAHLSRNRPTSLRVRLNFVETPENEHELEGVREWAAALGFEFFFRRQHCRGGSVVSIRKLAASSGCGIFAAVTFITAQGDVLSCVNDIEGTSKLGNVRDVSWADVLRWKRSTIADDRWFPACRSCDDDYRWVILRHGSVDPPPPLPGEAGQSEAE